MGTLFRFEVVGYRDAIGRFARREQKLVDGQRRMVRNSAEMFLEMLRLYAPHGETGKFGEGLAYRTDETGRGTSATIYVKGEHAFLLPMFVEGTKAHLIPKGGRAEQMAKGYPLHWIDESGEHHRAWEVHHPGTRPDPFIQEAKESVMPLVRDELLTVARDALFA